jgi:hypothetical protein
MASRIRTVGRWMAFVAIALLLAACVRVDMELEVSPENTVSGSAILAVDDSLLELSGQTADDLFRDVETTADLPEGASVEPYEDDGFVGQRITFEDVSLEEFSQGGVAASGEQLSITRQGDDFHVNGRLDMTGSEFGGSEVPTQFLESIEFRIAITFPGPVSSATGSIEGNTVTWTPRVGENTELRAVASAIPSGSPLVPILLIVGVIVLAIVAFVVLSRQRAPAPAAAPASGWSEPSPPTTGQATTDVSTGAPPPTPQIDRGATPSASDTTSTSGSTSDSTDTTDVVGSTSDSNDTTDVVHQDAREDPREDRREDPREDD